MKTTKKRRLHLGIPQYFLLNPELLFFFEKFTIYPLKCHLTDIKRKYLFMVRFAQDKNLMNGLYTNLTKLNLSRLFSITRVATAAGKSLNIILPS